MRVNVEGKRGQNIKKGQSTQKYINTMVNIVVIVGFLYLLFTSLISPSKGGLDFD